MDQLLKKYNLLFIKLEKLNKDNDNESSHILQDKIYRKFIASRSCAILNSKSLRPASPMRIYAL